MHKYFCSSSLYIFLVIKSLPALANDSFNQLEVDLISLYNPLGISFSAMGYHRQIYHHDESVLWDNLYYQWGAQANINPAFIRTGIHFEWMPVAILQIRGQYDWLHFNGSSGSLLSFSSSDQPFGDDELEARKGDEISDNGSRASLHLTLRAKFNKTIIRNVTNFSYYQFPGVGPFYLEREHEILVATNDHIVSNQLFLLFENNNEEGHHSFFGPYHNYVYARNSDMTSERLGVTWYQEYDTSYGALQKTRWYIQSGVYLHDPNRKDQLYLIFGIGGDY
ncbi:MAG: hypothetical protein OEY66_02855 [Gammaproteobacteria bacterium]|nr:hypothetical protein [Gammaproteobacteria bacterium]